MTVSNSSMRPWQVTADAYRDVRAVREIRVVSSRGRESSASAGRSGRCLNREQCAVPLHGLMAVCLRGRNVGDVRNLDQA